ncbi:hypothetical protein [Oerskovia flava]|uniref:hypothetical protein n=1 Tax=Oerskovia flava TaxID=2986422 RepID=UPI00223F88BE|nr:hypothetical protein [Oerskovia sp. JB1-3-2]
MPLFRHGLPDAVRRSLDLPAGDSILTSAELVDGSWAIASRGALTVASADAGTAGPARTRPWYDVDRAAFDPETTTITIEWVDADTTLLPLANARRTALAQTVRERVQSSVVLAETLTFPGGGKAKVAVRRDAQGGLFSQVVAHPGLDLGDPSVIERIDLTEARLRSASGLPL